MKSGKMARRLASALYRHVLAGSSPSLASVERCLPAAATYAASVLGHQQWWGVQGVLPPTTNSSRGFASESESALNYAEDFDYISYPPPRAFVGQMAPDFEAPGVI